MIVETTFQGRPAQVMYMTTGFEPVDDELLATLVKVTFLDEQGGALFLVPRSSGIDGHIERSAQEKRARYFTKGRHIQDPETGLMQGSEPGPSVEGGGGSGSTSGGKRGKINEASFAKDGVEFHSTNPEKAMQRWNQRIKMLPGEFRDKFLGGDGVGDMEVTYYANRDTFNVKGQLFDNDGNTIGNYENEINFQDNVADAVYLEYDDANQGKGHARQLMAANVAAYQELDLKQMDLEAAKEVGGYAWAKYGCVPTKRQWGTPDNPTAFRLSLEAGLNRMSSGADKRAMTKLVNSSDPRAIWAIADSKNGKDMLLGTVWLGSLNFSDKKAMRRFDGYIAKKK